MGIILSFLPFIAFALLTRAIAAPLALAAGAAVGAGLVLRDRRHGSEIKLLETATVILFLTLAASALLPGVRWSVLGARLAVDAGLCAIVLTSLVLRRPFTLQYARTQVPPALQTSPIFLAANMRISAAWAIAFALMTAADTVMLAVPGIPLWPGVVAAAAALVGAVRFTTWYPHRLRRLHQVM